MKSRYILGKTYNILRARRKFVSKYLSSDMGLVKVLMYHDVPENKLEQFAGQIKYLHDNYPFLTPNDFHSFINGDNCISGLHLLITFDDGFLSSKIAAEKILGPLGIKAVFFITANFVKLSDEPEWKSFVSERLFDGNKPIREVGSEYAPMNKEDLIWLKNNGHTIGSHSLNHARLSDLSGKELELEIVESGDFLGKLIGVAVDDFAYPYGNIESISAESMVMVRRQYKYCFSGIRGFNKPSTSPMAIFRDSVSLDDTPGYLRFVAEDGLSVMYYRKSRTLRDMADKISVG